MKNDYKQWERNPINTAPQYNPTARAGMVVSFIKSKQYMNSLVYLKRTKRGAIHHHRPPQPIENTQLGFRYILT
jgi:hypothetical protein